MPPAGAAFGPIEIGNEAVCVNGRFSVAGTVTRFGVTVTVSVPSLNPDALARTVVDPAATPLSVTWPIRVPSGIVTTFGGWTPTIAGLSLVTVTSVPPTGASAGSVIFNPALRPRPI